MKDGKVTAKFMDHTPLHLAYLCSGTKGAKYRDPYIQQQVIKNILQQKQFTEYNFVSCEIRWINAKAPFFNLYPQVSKALQKTSLNITPSSIEESIVHRLGSVCVKLSSCSEILRRYGVGWFFIDFARSVMVNQVNDKNAAVFNGFCVAYQTRENVFCFATKLDTNFEEAEHWLKKDQETEDECECRRLIARVAIGVLLLASDPDYIKPVLLKADEGKTTPIEERISRAKNRGVYGFTIGEDIERCPHFRRPHFAIRWTGKGGSVPKLVAVKGAVINKSLMTTVPTGWEEIDSETPDT